MPQFELPGDPLEQGDDACETLERPPVRLGPASSRSHVWTRTRGLPALEASEELEVEPQDILIETYASGPAPRARSAPPPPRTSASTRPPEPPEGARRDPLHELPPAGTSTPAEAPAEGHIDASPAPLGGAQGEPDASAIRTSSAIGLLVAALLVGLIIGAVALSLGGPG